MPSRVEFSARSLTDLAAIQSWIARNGDPVSARRHVLRLIDLCESFGEVPYRGTARDDLLPGLRNYGWGRSATTIFQVKPGLVRIIGVFSAGRDVEGDIIELL